MTWRHNGSRRRDRVVTVGGPVRDAGCAGRCGPTGRNVSTRAGAEFEGVTLHRVRARPTTPSLIRSALSEADPAPPSGSSTSWCTKHSRPKVVRG